MTEIDWTISLAAPSEKRFSFQSDEEFSHFKRGLRANVLSNNMIICYCSE